MLRSQKKSNYEKLLFKSYYCANCQQQKSCDQLAEGKNYCCPCYSQEILEELEQEGLLISSAQQKLNNYRSGVIACQYSEVEKPRIKYISYDGNGWICCPGCERRIESAGHHGVIKNRNDPSFWGLNVPQKVLCGDCLKNLVGQMPINKKYTFKKYRKRYDF